MSWNYRVMEWGEEGQEKWRTIHEVFYDEQGNPIMYSDTPEFAIATQNDDGTWEDLGTVLDMMRSALVKPILTAASFVKEKDANAPPEC